MSHRKNPGAHREAHEPLLRAPPSPRPLGRFKVLILITLRGFHGCFGSEMNVARTSGANCVGMKLYKGTLTLTQKLKVWVWVLLGFSLGGSAAAGPCKSCIHLREFFQDLPGAKQRPRQGTQEVCTNKNALGHVMSSDGSAVVKSRIG